MAALCAIVRGTAATHAALIATMVVIGGGYAQLLSGITSDELAYAVGVGAAVRMEWDNTSIIIGAPNTISPENSYPRWIESAFVPNANKLYAAPFNDDAVLIVDPATNAADTTTLGGLGVGGQKWAGIAYVATVNKLFASPYSAVSVLVVDPQDNTTRVITVNDIQPGGEQWHGVAYAPIVNKLFSAPYDADSVLIVDPVTYATDVTSLSGLGSVSQKWIGIVFVPGVNKLYAAPHNSDAVLIVDPITNTTDTTTLAGFFVPTGGLPGLWAGITFAPNVNKVYAAPWNAGSMLTVDPFTNTTDNETLGGLNTNPGRGRQAKLFGVAFVPGVNKLFACPTNSDAVVMVDPVTNATDNITFSGIGYGGARWLGITFVPTVSKLFSVPYYSNASLIVDFAVDENVLIPFRRIADLTDTIAAAQDSLSNTLSAQSSLGQALSSLQTSLSTTEGALASTHAALVSARAYYAETFATQSELSTLSQTVCNRPVCAPGTLETDGTCVRNC